MNSTIDLFGVLLLLFGPCFGQTATTRWDGRITDLSYTNQMKCKGLFWFALQNTCGVKHTGIYTSCRNNLLVWMVGSSFNKGC